MQTVMPAEGGSASGGKTILIVEDEVGYIIPLEQSLAAEGFNTLRALNGEEGLKSALANRPDLILLDIVMPVMDGLFMLKELRKDEWGRHAKIILLSNLSDIEKIQEALNYDIEDYLVKSNWDLPEAVNLIKEKI